MTNEGDVSLGLTLHPKQALAFDSEATEILYGGSAGSGKSHLLRVKGISACSLIPTFQFYLFRLHYEDLIKNHMEGPTGFRAMLAPWADAGLVKIVETEIRFWNGSRIYLCHFSDENAIQKYYGAEMHGVGIEEATQLKERWIRFIRSRCRIPKSMVPLIPSELRGRFPFMIYATNPVGVSQSYFRKRFVKDIAPYPAIIDTDDEEGGFRRQYIPARLEDNPSIDAGSYRKALRGLGDEALVDALEHGNWDAIVGDFFPQYDDELHCVPDFLPPRHWFKYRSFDWGSAEPFVVHWWCVSDGEEFKDQNGRTRWFPVGAIICYREWYGAQTEQPSKGLGLSNREIAMGILERSLGDQVSGTVADSKPFQSTGGQNAAELFDLLGVPLTMADTSRFSGWSMLRDRLIGFDGYPMIYFCESCIHIRDYLPALPRHPTKGDDAAEHGEATHCCDSARYACTSRPMTQYAEKELVTAKLTPNRITYGRAVEEHLRKRGKQKENYY